MIQANTLINIPGAEIDFFAEIEARVLATQMSFIDAILEWCQKREVDPELIAGLIKKRPELQIKIQDEAEQLNLIKKTTRVLL